MGRGVFAARSFKKGELIEVSPAIVVTGEDYDLVSNSKLRFYQFEVNKFSNSSAIALGVGSLINHDSLHQNVSYKYDPIRDAVVFKTLRPITKNEQLFIDYGYDPVEKLKKWELQKVTDERKEPSFPDAPPPTDPLVNLETLALINAASLNNPFKKIPRIVTQFFDWANSPVFKKKS